ncbi:hypothetical protein FJY69_06155, partial [candidate division WOR-3 bacterium]|nr:hypothetical protein [candidate division WOR-3 bacterium]
ALDFDPRLSWYTLETEHFSVHFSSPGRPDDDRTALAQEVADICEEVRATVTPVANWAPRSRVQVVIADFYDYLNGWAAPFPDNTITIIPTPPGRDLGRGDDWLRALILHEYSHIIEMDRVRGLAAGLRTVFGRIILPNALAPAWLHEGYAIYNETRFSSGGRLRSTEYDMMARAAADAGRLLPVDRCGSYELQRYPGGSAPYLYGSWLHRYAAGETDPDVWERYNRDRSAGLPYFENWHARRVLGRSIYQLWKGTGQELTRHASALSRQLGQTTRLNQLTREGYWTSSPLWSRSGAEVYYLSRTGREYPAIKALDTTNNTTGILARGRFSGSLSLSPDGRELALTRLGIARNYYETEDIFALDLGRGSVRQITRGERARDPDFAPDTSLLVYVARRNGRSSLRLLDLATGSSTALAEPDDRTSFHGPRFSPSGKWIAVGISRPDGSTDVELVDRRTGWTVPVTDDRACDLDPCWSRTGRYLFFVSDRSGVFNLYAYQVASGKTLRCTNVPYGVFQPAVSPDNRRIALTSFSADGYDLSVMELDAQQWHEAEPFVDTLPGSEPEPALVPSELYYYNPFPAIWPKFWLPWAAFGGSAWELGAFTMGWDALQFHRYWLTAGARQDSRRPFLAAAYEFRRMRPALSLSLDLDPRVQICSLGNHLAFLGTRSGSWLSVACRFRRDSAVRARAGLNWTYSNALAYRFNVAPTEGRVCGLYADGIKKGVLSEQDRVRLVGWWTEYLGRPPGLWSLRCRLAVGNSFTDSAARAAFFLGDGAGLLSVRGYPEDTLGGRTVAAGGLQFRLPLAWVERGLGTGPLFLRNLSTALFAEAGLLCTGYAPSVSELARTRVGAGAELRTDLLLGHFVPVSLTSGIGFGLNPFWSYRGYVGLQTALPGGLMGNRPDDPLPAPN